MEGLINQESANPVFSWTDQGLSFLVDAAAKHPKLALTIELVTNQFESLSERQQSGWLGIGPHSPDMTILGLVTGTALGLLLSAFTRDNDTIKYGFGTGIAAGVVADAVEYVQNISIIRFAAARLEIIQQLWRDFNQNLDLIQF